MQDYHLHTTHSVDGRQTMDELCRAALARGLKHIAITDHEERPPARFVIPSKQAYLEEIERMKALYPALSIARGMELDYNPAYWQELCSFPEKYALDFAFVSLHWVDGMDPYDADFFKNRTQQESYRRFLEALLDMVKALRGPWVLGHLTYVSKFAPFSKRELYYEDHADIFDAILRETVHRGFGIEINTSGLKEQTLTLPSARVIERYRQLGGEILTVGSDAHTSGYVGFKIPYALEIARNAGFKYVTVFKERKAEFIAI